MRTLIRRPRSRGQALTELAIAAPFLLLLLVGAAQFAFLAYAGISVQTAAREGARIAAENPTAVSPVPSCPATPPASGQSTGNPVCDAIYRGAGLLGGSNLSISVTAPDTAVSAVPPDVVRVDNPHSSSSSSSSSSTTTAGGCNGQTVAVAGAVSPAQTASITDNGTNVISKTTLSDGTFTLCLQSQNGSHHYTDTIYFTSQACSSTQATVDVTVDSSGATPATISVSLPTATCTTTTSTTTTTTTSTSTTATTSSSSASSFGSSSSSTFACSGTLTGQYVTVSVSYQAPVFVPGLSWLLGSTHTMTATVTMRVESCDVQGGGG